MVTNSEATGSSLQGDTVIMDVRVCKTDLSILIEELGRFAFEHETSQTRFDSAVKDFADSSDRIQEVRENTENIIGKLYEQYEDHEVATEAVKENVQLFSDIKQLLQSEIEPTTSAEEREAFESEKLLLTEAIEKYQCEIADLESLRPIRLEEMKIEHDKDLRRLEERKQSLGSQIQAHLEDFERQKTELKVKHDCILEKLSGEFRSRLSMIEVTKSHRKCQTELASWRNSWSETLQGLEVAIERTKEKISGLRSKKRRSPSLDKTSKKRRKDPRVEPEPSIEFTYSCIRPCSVVIEPLEEIPDSSEELSPSGSTDDDSLVQANAAFDTDQSSESCLTSPEQTPSRRRLFTEQPIEETLGPITEPTPFTIDGYLKSLRKMVTENTKEQRKDNKKRALKETESSKR